MARAARLASRPLALRAQPACGGSADLSRCRRRSQADASLAHRRLARAHEVHASRAARRRGGRSAGRDRDLRGGRSAGHVAAASGRARPAAGAAPARPPRRPRRRHRGARAAASPPARHRESARDRPGERPTRARGRARRPRRPLPVDAGRARRDRRVGAALLRASRGGRLDGARAVRPAGRQARAAPGDPLSERPARHRPRAERRGRPAAQRLAGQRLGRREAALRRPRRLRADEHSQGVRRRRLRGAPEPAEADGDGRERARRRPDPGHRRALPRLHVDPAGEPRPGPDREPRDPRLHGCGRRLLPRRHPHARLAHLRGPRGLVPELRLPAAGGHDLPPGAEGAPGRADGRAGPRPGDRHEGGRARLPPARADRPQLVDPGDVAPRARHARPRRNRLPQGHRDPAARRFQHPRQPLLLAARAASTARRRPASTSSSSTRRATTSTAIAWRWTGCCRTGRDCRSSPGRAPRA